mmetsp:Transcript_29629/g.78041  ORF Transcript_29629/g.78041 Transcript_29629/m.78041 type:complete len:87 (+) Transcript_29629:151-411(+)
MKRDFEAEWRSFQKTFNPDTAKRQRSISKRLSSPSPRQMRIATDRMNAQEHLQIYMASRLYLKYFFNFQDSMSYNQLKLAMPFERG